MDLHPIPTISLFTGSGMLDAAIEFALERFGLRAVPLAYAERDSAAAAVILAWMEAQALGEAPICDSLESFDGTIFRPYMAGGLLLASPPCQPYSSAGKRAGNADYRSHGQDGSGPLVHLIRIIGEVRPAVVFFENVPEWVTGGAFQRFGDELSNLGYSIEEPFFLAAEDVGAPHERERVFVLAHAGLQHLKLFKRFHGSEHSGGGINLADTASGSERVGQRIGAAAGAGSESWVEGHREELADTRCERNQFGGVSGKLGGAQAAESCEAEQRQRNGDAARDRDSAIPVAHSRHGGNGVKHEQQLRECAAGIGESGDQLAERPSGGFGVGGESPERDGQPDGSIAELAGEGLAFASGQRREGRRCNGSDGRRRSAGRVDARLGGSELGDPQHGGAPGIREESGTGRRPAGLDGRCAEVGNASGKRKRKPKRDDAALARGDAGNDDSGRSGDIPVQLDDAASCGR